MFPEATPEFELLADIWFLEELSRALDSLFLIPKEEGIITWCGYAASIFSS